MNACRHIKPGVQLNKESSCIEGKNPKFIHVDVETARNNLENDVKFFYQIFVNACYTRRNAGILKKASCRIVIICTCVPWLWLINDQSQLFVKIFLNDFFLFSKISLSFVPRTCHFSVSSR